MIQPADEEVLRVLLDEVRAERRLLARSLAFIAELDGDNKRLQSQRSEALERTLELLSEALAREQRLDETLRQERAAANDAAAELRARSELLRQEYESSTSWRVSAPVRWFGHFVRRLRGGSSA